MTTGPAPVHPARVPGTREDRRGGPGLRLGGVGGAAPGELDAFAQYLPAGAPGQRLGTARLGSRTALFEGWLDRRTDLADAVDLPEGSDEADLILAAYRRWGEALFGRLGGSFALCIVDDEDGSVLALRDPLGVTPLFYAFAGGRIVLSPSVESLRRHPQVSGELNREALATHLLTEGRDVRRSFYAQVHRLLPGHVLRTRAGSEATNITRYWSPLDAGESLHWNGDHEIDRFPAVLSEAVERHLRLGRAGIYLSGGLDSGTVATAAADTARANGLPLPHAYSLVFDDPESNEERVQRGVAGGLDLPHTTVPVNLTTDPIEAYFASLALNEDWPHPLASTFRSVYLDLGARAVAEGCELILTGDGGDEWLAIHHALAADLLRRLETSELRALVDTVQATHGLPRLRAGRRVLWDHGVKLLLVAALSEAASRLLPGPLDGRRRRLAHARLPDWFAPDPELRAAVVDRIARPPVPASEYHGAIVRDTLEHPLTLLYLEESYESGRRIGAPILKPFYGPQVVTFLARTPPRLRSRGGQFKGLLRTLLHARFPHLGFDRQPKPYATNFNATMVFEGLARDWPRLRGFDALADLGIVDGTRVGTMVADTLRRGALADRQSIPKVLWMLLCSERWVRSRRGA